MVEISNELNNNNINSIMTLIDENKSPQLFFKVNLLINNGKEINKSDKTGKNALHYSCLYGNYRLAKLLIELGINKETTDLDLNTPLIYALKSGFKKLVIYLSDSDNCEKKEKNYQIVLEYGSKFGNKKMILLAVKMGSKLNKFTNYLKLTPLFLASDKDNPKILNLLLKLGSNIESKSDTKATPLIYASYFNYNNVKLLMNKGSNHKIRDKYGFNASEYSIRYNNKSRLLSNLLIRFR